MIARASVAVGLAAAVVGAVMPWQALVATGLLVALCAGVAIVDRAEG